MKKIIIAVALALAASLTVVASPADASGSKVTLNMAEHRHRDTGLIYHTFRLNWRWNIPLQDGATDWAKLVTWHEATNFDGTRMGCGFWSKYGYTHTDFKLYVWQPSTGKNVYLKGRLNCQEDTTAAFDKGLSHTPRFYMRGHNDSGDQINYRVTYVDHLIWKDDTSGQFSGHLQTY